MKPMEEPVELDFESCAEWDAAGRCRSAFENLCSGCDNSNRNSYPDLYWSLAYRMGETGRLEDTSPQGPFQKSLQQWMKGARPQSLSLLRRWLGRNTDNPMGQLQLAIFLKEQKLVDEALDVLSFQTAYAPAIFYRAEILLEKKAFEKARALLISLPDEVAPAGIWLWKKALALEGCGEKEAALAALTEAAPTGCQAEAFWIDYARVAYKLAGQSELERILAEGDALCGESLGFTDKAVALCKSLEVHETEEKYLQECLNRGGNLDKVLPEWIYNCSRLFAKGKRPEKIAQARLLAENLTQSLASNPEVQYALANVHFYDNRIREGLKALEVGHALDHKAWNRMGPYLFHSLYDDRLPPEVIFEKHRKVAAEIERRIPQLETRQWSKQDGEPLRVGWVSPDMRTHPVGYFLDAVVDAFPSERIETYFYDNYDSEDAVAKRFRIRSGWRNIRGVPDAEVVKMVEADKIDLLVDLAGYTTGNRITLFARKPAPLQVAWLGYPSTTGLSRIDYRISDSWVEPEGDADRFSTEQIWRMPNGFHAFRPPFPYSDVSPLPALKEGLVTFGCYNNLHKINESVLKVWADILIAVPQSRLLLKHENLAIPENRVWIAEIFKAKGVDLKRLHFKGRMDHIEQHIAAYSWVDIALDPFPYNGTTTNCDALYMGVPVIGLEGDRHASRVTASFMRRLGLEDWVAATKEDYVRIAREKASDLQSLAELRAGLRQRFIDSPLGNPEAFAKDLADAFWGMWEEAKNDSCDGPRRTNSRCDGPQRTTT